MTETDTSDPVVWVTSWVGWVCKGELPSGGTQGLGSHRAGQAGPSSVPQCSPVGHGMWHLEERRKSNPATATHECQAGLHQGSGCQALCVHRLSLLAGGRRSPEQDMGLSGSGAVCCVGCLKLEQVTKGLRERWREKSVT